MNLLPETFEIQSKISSYCRTGIDVYLPGVSNDRLKHYRRLIFNNIEDNLMSSFPIAFEYLENDKWDQMVDSFISNHSCKSNSFWQLSGEFCDYIAKMGFSETLQLPFLTDLLKFEWEEIVVYNMEDIPPKPHSKKGDLLHDILLINPEFSLLNLTYPIHLFNPNIALEKPGNYFVLLYRDAESGAVEMMDLSIWFVLLIEQISKGEFTLSEIISEAPSIFGEINLEELTTTTIHFIQDLKSKNFILGFKSNV